MNNLYRTMFFVPGNDPYKILKAEVYRPDCIIYDLEDSVSIHEKDSARLLIKYALQDICPDLRVGVRINSLDSEYIHDDVSVIVPCKPDFLRLPKTETAADVHRLDDMITKAEVKAGIEIGTVKIVCTIETALGVYNAYSIATASKRVIAIGLGAEDFCTDMKTSRSESGIELEYARGKFVLEAHAAKVMAMDFVYSDVRNHDGFRANVMKGKQLGYTGKSVVHPDQIRIVHECYKPTEKEIARSQAILEVYEEAMKAGSGVISLNGKMIDMPMVIRAQDLLAYAAESEE